MRYLAFTFLVFCSRCFFAQVEDYYKLAEGLTGDSLEIVLYEIINHHKEFPYSNSKTDVWDILKDTDRDTLDSSKVILFYTGWSVDADQEYNSGKGWTREHVWAKSRGDFGTTNGPGTDVHALRPVDVSTNSARNNRWFAASDKPYIDNDGETGCKTSDDFWTWEPRDEVKGDVARMIFYMAVRYQGQNGEPDLEIVDSLPSDKNTKLPIHAKLTDLLEWHELDPVSEWEKRRNDTIFEKYQHNRNPFIDHPEWVRLIWNLE